MILLGKASTTHAKVNRTFAREIAPKQELGRGPDSARSAGVALTAPGPVKQAIQQLSSRKGCASIVAAELAVHNRELALSAAHEKKKES